MRVITITVAVVDMGHHTVGTVKPSPARDPCMAQPLRFRYSPERWTRQRIRRDLLEDLDGNLGATMSSPWYALKGPYECWRFDMDNGDTALFAWNEEEAYWIGNTETPQALWRTDKFGFDEIPDVVATWAERELLAELRETAPWITPYEELARFFLPVLCSKDGRESTRTFFRDHTAGFPDTDLHSALSYYDGFLESGVLDAHRHEMAGKLGTSPHVDEQRMAAAMSEFTVAKLLTNAGYQVEPEIGVRSGHSIDFKASKNGSGHLVEVTRPGRPTNRRAGTAPAAVRDTVDTKRDGQLEIHGGGIVLLVDCSSFTDTEWERVYAESPDVGHRPAIVFRTRPDGTVAGYGRGAVPLEFTWV